MHFRGLVESGENEKTIFTLPVGCRPSGNEVFPVVCSGGSPGVIGSLYVKSNGEVFAGETTNVWVSLCGVTFLAER